LLRALDERFSKSTCEVLSWMAALSPTRWGADSKSNIEKLCNLYCLNDKAVFEYVQFSSDEERQKCTSFSQLLRYMSDFDYMRVYPNLFHLVKIIATVPITTNQSVRTST
jgi:hypothetical protein